MRRLRSLQGYSGPLETIVPYPDQNQPQAVRLAKNTRRARSLLLNFVQVAGSCVHMNGTALPNLFIFAHYATPLHVEIFARLTGVS